MESCPHCKSRLYKYDKVKRLLKSTNGRKQFLKIQRYRCPKCGKIHRNLPDCLFPYKHYNSEIIIGVIDGLITCETLGYEDYPCEMTMKRWIGLKDNLKRNAF